MYQRLGWVGLGQMAKALASGLTHCDLPLTHCGFDPHAVAAAAFREAVPGVLLMKSNVEVAENVECLVLAVKPHIVAPACEEIRAVLSPDQLVVSLAAGVALDTLTELLNSERVVRVMPNTPALVGAGASAYAAGAGAGPADRDFVQAMLSTVGLAVQVEDRLLDAVTGLSGSGPAYAFSIIEALADGGVLMGLPRGIAQQLAAQTLLGAAQMVLRGIGHPAELKDRVASPGGTTIAGLQAFEEHGGRAACIAAVEAAAQRSLELKRASRGDT